MSVTYRNLCEHTGIPLVTHNRLDISNVLGLSYMLISLLT